MTSRLSSWCGAVALLIAACSKPDVPKQDAAKPDTAMKMADMPAMSVTLSAVQIAHGGVDHLSALEKNHTEIGVTRQREFAGLPRHAHKLNDVGQRQLFQRTLECHFAPMSGRAIAGTSRS